MQQPQLSTTLYLLHLMLVTLIWRRHNMASLHNQESIVVIKNQKIKTIMKNNLASLSALLLLLSGIVLSFMGFYEPPRGEISDSVLWFFSQTLIYAGSVWGIKIYVDHRLRQRK